MKVTLKDLAGKSNVSIACVSDIPNGKIARYNAETVKRIRQIGIEMDYKPNIVAKSMITKKSMTIGLILPDITNPFFPQISRGVSDRSTELGYTTILINSDNDIEKEQNAFNVLEQKMVNGVIFIPSIYSNQKQKERETKFPCSS